MLDAGLTWLLAHPLQGVGILALGAVVFGALLIPRVQDVVTHGHPRC